MLLEKNNSSNKPSLILVTGMVNSGTTWVGKMLSIPKNIVYIHEPFNLNQELGICHIIFDKWYTYITGENHNTYFNSVSKTINFQYDLFNSLKNARGPVGLRRRLHEYFLFKKAKEEKWRPLIKDPLAFFSSPWIYDNFKSDVIITVRHPAAMVNSSLNRGWGASLKDLISQKLLLRDYLRPYEKEILSALKKPDDNLGHLALSWKIFYSTAKRFKLRYPSWKLLQHENLVNSPFEKYKEIYASLGLQDNREYLKNKLEKDNEKLRSGKVMANEWKENLNLHQINRIREIVGETANLYYNEKSWDIK